MAKQIPEKEPGHLPGNYQYGLHHQHLIEQMIDPVRSAKDKLLDLDQIAKTRYIREEDKRFSETKKNEEKVIDDYISDHPLETQGKSRREIRQIIDAKFTSKMEITQQKNDARRQRIIDLALSKPHKWISYKGKIVPINTIFKTKDEQIYLDELTSVMDTYKGIPIIAVLVSTDFAPYNGGAIKEGEQFKIQGDDTIYTADFGIYSPFYKGKKITHVKRGGRRKTRRNRRKSRRSRR
jgi:hypothetical protein